jgi:ribosomal protein S19
MSRIKWKGPYVKNRLLIEVKRAKSILKKKLKFISRNSVILPQFSGLTFFIYNGKSFVAIKITDEMVGHKIGEFVNTRKQFTYKKKKKKK